MKLKRYNYFTIADGLIRLARVVWVPSVDQMTKGKRLSLICLVNIINCIRDVFAYPEDIPRVRQNLSLGGGNTTGQKE